MKIETIINSYIDENTYIIYDENKAIIVDPGSDFEVMKDFLNNNKLNQITIYLTHGHIDHILSVEKIQKEFNALVYTHEKELDLLSDPAKNLTTMDKPFKLVDVIGLKDEFILDGFNLKIYHVPGHTSGHSMLYVEELNSLFTGDFVFKHEIGRCDLPTGSLKDMYSSLEILRSMDHNIKIYSGHGPVTSIKEELKHNPYLNRK